MVSSHCGMESLVPIAIKMAKQSGEKRRHGAALSVDGKVVTGYNQMYCVLHPRTNQKG